MQPVEVAAFHARSLADPDGFWREQAELIDWFSEPATILDASRLPFAGWFGGGTTNLCHNAVDRHLAARGDQTALVWISSEVEQVERLSYADLHDEVNVAAAMLTDLGVVPGDRVLIYLPMIVEAIVSMLACVRIGAIHSVVFGGFGAPSLAARIEDARPRLVISADAGMRMGRIVPYKGLLDEAISLAAHRPASVVMVDRGIAPFAPVADRDLDWATLRARHQGARVPCAELPSEHPSYILYTSGTTGTPKGVQRDTAGHAVALAASMRHIYDLRPGETMFTTSDIGWVVGHSYIVYGPLLNGSTTIAYEGVPVRPDAGVWWHIVEAERVTTMFSSPTAIRVLKKHDISYMRDRDTSSLRRLFLAGEPLDESTALWVEDALQTPVIDHYWQTETGWPILSAQHGIADHPVKPGSPSFPVYGYDTRLIHETTFDPVGPGEKGMLCIAPPLPPGCLQTVWGDDERFVETYFTSVPGQSLYATFDYATVDADGYFTLLGRTDDVINVAGHRLGTREIEEAIQAYSGVAEVAVVGVKDEIKGQVPVAFVVLKDPSASEGAAAEIVAAVDRSIGAIGRPARVYLVGLLPKTRSGKLLRRALQALAEGRDPGDLTTIEDPAALDQIRIALEDA